MATVLALPAVAYGICFPWLRIYGDAPLLLTLLSSLLAVLLPGHQIISKSYVPFFLYSLTILFVSLASLMPHSWAVQHSNMAALRHWFYVPAVAIFSGSYLVLLQLHFEWVKRHAFKLFLAALVLSRFARFLSGDTSTPETGYLLYAVTNDVALTLIIFLIWLFRRKRMAWTHALIIGAMLLISASNQLQLFWLLVGALVFIRKPERVSTITFIATGLFVLWAPSQIVMLHNLDHNTGIRALLWRDVWVAMADTAGSGIGYGTEYIRNDFSEISWHFYLGSSRDDLFVGTHSAYYDVLLRDGVVGCCLFLAWFVSAIRVRASAPRLERATASAAAMLMIINSAINVGASSANFLLGTSACVACLEFYRLRREPALSPASRQKGRDQRRGVERVLTGGLVPPLDVA